MAVRIVHKVNRKERIVTDAQADAIKANPMVSKHYHFHPSAETPDEVKALQEKNNKAANPKPQRKRVQPNKQ